MTLSPIQSAIQTCRRQTLDLIAGVDDDILKRQAHPDFSPVGWHLGHIAYTEALWILEHLAGLPRLFPLTRLSSQYERLFAADGLPKSQRQNLPAQSELLAYMAQVRSHTIDYLQGANIDQNIRLWHWLIQHESQHIETITMVLMLHQQQGTKTQISLPKAPARHADGSEMILIAAGDFMLGSDAPAAIDNERPAHRIFLHRYWIDRRPVTCDQFQQFIDAGGYQQAKWWSKQGWQWQQRANVSQPLYWREDGAENPDAPVCGVNWYEADAYARFAGKRLPTESEWAKAAGANAGCEQMLGSVWEWTATWFAAYPGFWPFPYKGYSQIYFDGAHRVLRGGSWATPKWALRHSFRNWYHPHRREMFAGFRCVVRCVV